MLRRRVSVRDLAAELEVSEMYVSRRLNGQTPIHLNDLELIADALGVPIAQFLPPVPAESSV